MKKITTILAAATLLLGGSCAAQAENQYGSIDYEGTKLLSAPNAKSSAVDQLDYGVIVTYDENGKSGDYIKVKTLVGDKTGYVAATKVLEANYPLEAPELANAEPDEPFLLNIETLQGGEVTEGWSFWKDGSGVRAAKTIRLIYNNGSMRTNEFYYKGVARPGYLLLTEEVQYGENSGEKLETPIVIYEDIAGRAGVFEGGKCFTPGGQTGGFDTDDWD